MERIYDTREHFYKNCADKMCHNQTGPWPNEAPPFPVYCQDCVDEAVDTMLGRKEEEVNG